MGKLEHGDDKRKLKTRWLLTDKMAVRTRKVSTGGARSPTRIKVEYQNKMAADGKIRTDGRRWKTRTKIAADGK
jgi:hypothetical protein